MNINDLHGNSRLIQDKAVAVGSISIIITKWTPDGTKSKYYNGYEASTGHWVAVGATKDDVIKRAEARHDTIVRLIPKDSGYGGLFG